METFSSYTEVLQHTELFTLPGVLITAAILFGIGCIGVVLKRNIIIILMSVEVILNAINLAILGFATWPIPALEGMTTDMATHKADPQYFVLLVIAVAAVEAAIGLAILVSVFRTRRQVDTRTLQEMEG